MGYAHRRAMPRCNADVTAAMALIHPRRPTASRRRRARLVAGLALVCAADCNSTEIAGPSAWNAVLRVPGGYVFQLVAARDGALFASGSEGIYRALPPDYTSWRLVVPTNDVVTGLFASSAAELYAVTRGCGVVRRWSESDGWKVVYAADDISLPQSTSHESCPIYLDIWGRGGDEILVVGTGGAALHFDGASWRPLDLPLTSYPFPQGRTSPHLLSVAGNARETAIGGDAGIFVRAADTGVWTMHAPALSDGCSYVAAASTSRETLFAHNDCLTRIDAEGRASSERVPGLRTTLYGGESQADGALFWSYEGQVVAIEEGPRRVKVYTLPGISAIGGAVAIADYLYVAGVADGDGVVARTPR